MTLANLKGSVAKETIIVGFFLLGVLMFSSFMVFASRTDLTLESYMANADYLSGGFSDEQVLNMVQSAQDRLSDEDRLNLAGFSDQDVLSVARGTDEGLYLVASMSDSEEASANNLLREVVSSGSYRASYAWPWRKTTTPPAPAPAVTPVQNCQVLPGPCTPAGTVTCHAFEIPPANVGACEYTCSPAGDWVPTTRCRSGMCHGQRCAQL